jgi:predicted dehydrogenase
MMETAKLPGDQSPLRLGIVGTGFIGQFHARNSVASDAVELVAVASARGPDHARKLAAGLGAPVRALSIDAMLADPEVDGVLLATRTSDHASHAVEVLERGKHLLLEKPGAPTLAEHGLIAAAAARRPDLVTRVAYHRRHDPRFQELARLIDEGAIGEPYAVHSISREDYPPSDGDRFTGGFVMDVGVHDFDTARWLVGSDPRTVHALAHAPRYSDAELDNVYVAIDYGGRAGTVQLSRTSRVGLEMRFEVVGSEGSALLTEQRLGGGITVWTAARAHEFPPDCRAAFPDAYPRELADFAASRRGETVPGATLADDRWAIATALAARASAAREVTLEVGPDWDCGSRRSPRSSHCLRHFHSLTGWHATSARPCGGRCCCS